MRWLAAAALLILGPACATPSARYDRQLADPYELVIGQGVVTRQGRIVATGNNIDDLPGIVGCVDDARLYAQSAVDTLFAAKVTRWVSYGLGIASLATFAVGIVRQDNTLIGVALGTSGVSAIVSEVPRFLVPVASIDLIDAVNAFNDQFETAPRCANQRPKPPPPVAPPPPPPPKEEVGPPGGARF